MGRKLWENDDTDQSNDDNYREFKESYQPTTDELDDNDPPTEDSSSDES